MLVLILPVMGFFLMLISISGFIYGCHMVHEWLTKHIPYSPLTEDVYGKLGMIIMAVTFIVLIISIIFIGI